MKNNELRTQVELISIYDARASFYNKAKIRITAHKTGTSDCVIGYMLTSYSTDVAFAYAEFVDGETHKYIIDPYTLREINEKHPAWSQTTNRHIREFCKQWRNHDITVSNYGYLKTV